MDTITLEQLQKLFSDLRAETSWDVDGEMLWGYFFVDQDSDKLTAAGALLAEQGYEIGGVYENEDEPGFILHVQRAEIHTPDSLFARNAELETFSAAQGLEAYDGMDVSPNDDSEEGEDEEGGFENLDDPDFPTDEKEVTNPGLIAAIAKLETDSSEEAQMDLGDELQNATYLLPVFNDAEELENTSEEDEDEAPIQLLVCTNDDGTEFIPLFTDVDALNAWVKEPVNAMIFSADEAWDLILSQDDCGGAVINPGGQTLELDREQVELLYDALMEECEHCEECEDEDGDESDEEKKK